MTALLVDSTDLTKRYRPRVVVDHVGLRVRRGEVDGVLDLNGAGNTTTPRVLLGLVPPVRDHQEWAPFWPTAVRSRLRGPVGVDLRRIR